MGSRAEAWPDTAATTQGTFTPVWVTRLPEIECGECNGLGYFERVTGERQGMGGIEPRIREIPCEDCDDGMAQCVTCGETPSYQAPSFDRLCWKCLVEATNGE